MRQVLVAGDALLDLRITLRFQVVKVVAGSALGSALSLLDALVQVIGRSKIASP